MMSNLGFIGVTYGQLDSCWCCFIGFIGFIKYKSSSFRVLKLIGQSVLALSMHDSKKEFWCVTCWYLLKAQCPVHASLWSLKLKS